MKSLESYQTAHAGLFKTETCYIYHYTACNGLRFETIASSLDECRKARDRWLRSLSVSFTGHRHLSEHTDFLVLKLKNEIIRAYRTGKRFFKTGGAVGFDTLAAEVVLQLREHLPELALMVIVPFEGQDIYFSLPPRSAIAGSSIRQMKLWSCPLPTSNIAICVETLTW